MEEGCDRGIIDIEKTMMVLEPDKAVEGGLCIPGKDRVLFRPPPPPPPDRKSLLGLDVLAIAKRESKVDSRFKVPKERNPSSLNSLDEDEKSSLSEFDDVNTNSLQEKHTRNHRRYREAHGEDASHSEGMFEEGKREE
ncbi:hypothetical protein ACLOJK_037746 [Asimina triloba]